MKITRIKMICPDLVSQADAEQAREMLANTPGIEDWEIEYETHTVVAATAAQDSGESLLRTLEKAGFPAASWTYQE